MVDVVRAAQAMFDKPVEMLGGFRTDVRGGMDASEVIRKRDRGHAFQFAFGESERAGAAHENLRHFARGRHDLGSKEQETPRTRYAFQKP